MKPRPLRALVAEMMSYTIRRRYGLDVEDDWHIGGYVLPGNIQKVNLRSKALPPCALPDRRPSAPTSATSRCLARWRRCPTRWRSRRRGARARGVQHTHAARAALRGAPPSAPDPGTSAKPDAQCSGTVAGLDGSDTSMTRYLSGCVALGLRDTACRALGAS